MSANDDEVRKSPSGKVLFTFPEPPGDIIEPGADNQALFTRSGVVDWSNVRISDIPAGQPGQSLSGPVDAAGNLGWVPPSEMIGTMSVRAWQRYKTGLQIHATGGTNSQKITNWNDQSGNVFHTSRPFSGVLNPDFDFADGGLIFLAADSKQLVYGTNLNVMMGNRKWLWALRWGPSSVGELLECGGAAISTFRMRFNAGGFGLGELVYGPTTLGFGAAIGIKHTMLFGGDGTDIFVRVNGVEVARTAQALVSFSTGSFVFLGRSINDYMTGKLYESMLLTTGAGSDYLTTSNLEAIEAYLNTISP